MEQLRETDLPDWIQREQHQLIPDGGSVLVQPLGFGGKREDFVISSFGFAAFPEALISWEEFNRWLLELGRGSHELSDSYFLRVPQRYPNTLYKIDITNQGWITALTIARINGMLVAEEPEYLFKPIRMFWALKDLIHMELADDIVDPMTVEERGKMVSAKTKLIGRLKALNMDISEISSNDILYRGLDSRGVPIFSLVDLQDSRLLRSMRI